MHSKAYQEQHEMRLEKTLESGTQEWFCPACGRRLSMSLHSEHLNLKVLERGDESAIHTGGTGGLQMGLLGVDSTQNPTSHSGGTEGCESGSPNVTYH